MPKSNFLKSDIGKILIEVVCVFDFPAGGMIVFTAMKPVQSKYRTSQVLFFLFARIALKPR